MHKVQLRWLAHARSGDKGDTANVGLIALRPEWYALIRKEFTALDELRALNNWNAFHHPARVNG